MGEISAVTAVVHRDRADRCLAQTNTVAKRKLSEQSPQARVTVVMEASVPVAARTSTLPPNASDSWTGAGDGTSWNNASNWNNGVPNSSTVDVTIGTATAAVNEVEAVFSVLVI
jgi:hypothetical protein